MRPDLYAAAHGEGAERGLSMPGPLEGVRVVDLTMNVLGPMATQLLGDYGAEVIKVEAPGGDPVRQIGPCRTTAMGSYFLNLNRNKKSVVLDLKRPAARAALLKLIEAADVFVHNLRPGAIARLGLDYPSLARLNPRLVYGSGTGFRATSSRRDVPAFDDVMQGQCGLAVLNGVGGEPRYVPTVIADKFCGHTLASAIGMALYHRERTGRGQEVHVPMMETMLAFTLIEHLWGASIGEPDRGLGYPRMLSPHRRPYPTLDGHICLLANTDEQWRRLFAVIGQPELIDDPRFSTLRERANNIDALYGLVRMAMRERSTAEWRQRLDGADLPNGPANSVADLLADDYLAETAFFTEHEHPVEGRLVMMAVPVTFSGSPTTLPRLPATLGQDTAAVLHAAGLDAAAVADAIGEDAHAG